MAKRKPRAAHTGHVGVRNPAIAIAVCVFALAMLGASVLFSASLPEDTKDHYRIIEKQVMWMEITFIEGL